MRLQHFIHMQELQRFGGAMFTPVLLYAFFGVMISLSIIGQNPEIFGPLAQRQTIWHQFWYLIGQGAWTVFRQMPLLFAVALPIGLAKRNAGCCCMESLVIYLVFNYFTAGILTLYGPMLGIDYSQGPGGDSGLAMTAGIKTLDAGILLAILIASLTVWLHHRLFDRDLPDWLGLFKGPALVVGAGFFLMLPLAGMFCLIWPLLHHSLNVFQWFMQSTDVLGVWMYTFLERICVPIGLHHFIYAPFIYGPAIVDGGIQQYWLLHLPDFATSSVSLKELFPAGGFCLHGSAKYFGMPGIAAAIYATAKPERKRQVLGLLVPATLTAMFCGITEPLEFTFLFAAPFLFVLHAVLSATLAAVLYMAGVSGSFGGGLIDAFLQNWLPLFFYHAETYLLQFAIGISFGFLYFFLFRYFILRYQYETPGRSTDPAQDHLFSRRDYQNRRQVQQNAKSPADAECRPDEEAAFRETAEAVEGEALSEHEQMAAAFLQALGGGNNICELMNCATRLRVTVRIAEQVQPYEVFQQAGAYGVIYKDHAIQVVVGLSAAQIRGCMAKQLEEAENKR